MLQFFISSMAAVGCKLVPTRRDVRHFVILTAVLTGLSVGVVDASASPHGHADIHLCSAAKLLR